MPRPTLALLAALPLLLLAGCDETDAVAVRIRIEDDLSGTITTSALELPASGGRAPETAQAVQWDARVSLVCNHGRFDDLGAVRLADIGLASGANPSGLGYVSLTLPRGANAAWPHVLVPLTAEERARSAKAFDPSGKTAEVGATLKFEVTLPAAVLGNGLSGKTRGVRVSAEGEVATLLVPIEAALSAGEPFVWHLTWQR